jgi:squamous cell carcinoma antigen recognized by T-cells 3
MVIVSREHDKHKRGYQTCSGSCTQIHASSLDRFIYSATHQFCYNSSKGAASHLTKMLSTEFALKDLPIRVNAIAPGVWASEMTVDVVTPDLVDLIGKGTNPVPAKRGGT